MDDMAHYSDTDIHYTLEIREFYSVLISIQKEFNSKISKHLSGFKSKKLNNYKQHESLHDAINSYIESFELQLTNNNTYLDALNDSIKTLDIQIKEMEKQSKSYIAFGKKCTKDFEIQKDLQKKEKEKFIKLSKEADGATSVFEKSSKDPKIKPSKLQELLDDDDISEIMINGYDSIFIEKKGYIEKIDKKFSSEKKLNDIIQKMVSKVNRVVNESNPIVDARLSDGSRINVVLPPVSIDGSILTIRKFPKEVIRINSMIDNGTISSKAANFLKKLVEAKYNIFISGGTSTGKTTFLNALSDYIPSDERVITIEDSAELQIRSIPNLVSLETRNSNIEGTNQITIRNLIKTALRMRPDRILVGEVRDEAAWDLLNAYNTGHDGSISTGHANSTYDMLSRLESMVLMGANIPIDVIRKKISAALDIVIHLSRLHNKKRCVMEISEVIDYKNGEFVLNKIYKYDYDKGLISTGNKLLNTDKLKRAGIDIG